VRQLVGDEAIQRVGRLIDGQHHPIAVRLGEGKHAFRQLTGFDVLLLKFALGFVENQGDFEREVMLEVRADLLICAFRVARDPFEVLLDVGVVIDFEMIGRVDVPLEVVVADPVLAVVRHVARLREYALDRAGHEQSNGGRGERDSPARVARAHVSPRV
jgi:hypothetical protein